MCLRFGSKRTDPKCLTSLTVAPCTSGPDGKTANTLGPLLPPLSSRNGRKHGGGGLRSRDADDRVLSITTANCLAYLCALLSVCACVCVSRREDTRHATRFGPHPSPPSKKSPTGVCSTSNLSFSSYQCRLY